MYIKSIVKESVKTYSIVIQINICLRTDLWETFIYLFIYYFPCIPGLIANDRSSLLWYFIQKIYKNMVKYNKV